MVARPVAAPLAGTFQVPDWSVNVTPVALSHAAVVSESIGPEPSMSVTVTG